MFAEPSLPRTKIIGTIGPASESPEMLGRLIAHGLSVARVNLTHGDFARHSQVITRIRAAAAAAGRSVAIWGDLPGPKMRVEGLGREPAHLETGQPFILETAGAPTGAGAGSPAATAQETRRVSVNVPGLARAVHPGDKIYLNDGFLQLQVQAVCGLEIHCQVLAGGELRNRDGLNLPGVDLGPAALTVQDQECLAFAAREGLEAISPSFIQDAGDLAAVRQAAQALGYAPSLLAKIERARAVTNLEAILEAADAVVVARGDLGIETPLEEIALLQKRIIRLANLAGKPAITATHMLESMIHRRLPTRAEATDVANAILDGTDCLTLSAESARGHHPAEAVAFMARIARATEAYDPALTSGRTAGPAQSPHELAAWRTAREIQAEVQDHRAAAVALIAGKGAVAQRLSQLRLPVWTVVFCGDEAVCRDLHFYSGVQPVHIPGPAEDRPSLAREWLRRQGLGAGRLILYQDPALTAGDDARRLQVIDLSSGQY